MHMGERRGSHNKRQENILQTEDNSNIRSKTASN